MPTDPSMPVVERVARVLAGKQFHAGAAAHLAAEPAPAVVDHEWPEHVEAAIAVLKTLREPSPAMVAAGERAGTDIESIWEAMARSASGEAGVNTNQWRTTMRSRYDSDGETGRLLGAAAIGAAFAVAALVGRKFAVQAVTAARGDWLEAVKAEHEAARTIFDAIEATDEDATVRRPMLLAKLKHAIAKHAFQEENVLYPMLRREAQQESADDFEHDHGRIKTLLFEVGELAPSDPAWLAKIVELRQVFEEHAGEEEDDVFPTAHAAMTEIENAHILHMMTKTGMKLA